MEDLQQARRALISVSDKTGLVELARELNGAGIELISTGGSAATLREAGFKVTEVAEVTGFPEMMDGRVKTLHPAIHGGLLALRNDASHSAAMEAHGINPIDILVVNLYPFEATVAADPTYGDAIENIDIGGPAMIRAAAKNHAHVAVVTDPVDYADLLTELSRNEGATSFAFRQKLALTAYGRTAAYDSAISNWLAETAGVFSPRYRTVAGRLRQTLRYGENPHQSASFYTEEIPRGGIANAKQLQGKELSYNNINDTDAAYALVREFPADGGPACVIIKHANPCGAALAPTLKAAYERAFDCDRTSAFGGIIALNRPLDAETASAICEILTEVVVAPDADEAAKAVFAKRPNLRLLLTGEGEGSQASGLAFKQVAGGLLFQDGDDGTLAAVDLRIVTDRQPSEREMADLRFAWTVAKHVKSNAIVYARDGATVGVGAGQMSRVDSTRIAARKARDMAGVLGLDEAPTIGSVVASDAFFPFPDGVLTAAEAGATALIQPGGSVRDEEVIAAANDAGLAMVFTGMRHFRH
ncbi:MAG: bifunctional phosphoribosylaminoimidazolecarboxamide formyltransferase/IMP cyclohydrolase [Pseudomonadota bacterium]